MEARDSSQYLAAMMSMLRLFAQLLWSSEIQLFNGGNVPVRARRWYLDLEPGLGR